MRFLSQKEAENFLRPIRLEIDCWNRLKYSSDSGAFTRQQWLPDGNQNQYVVSAHLAQWLSIKDWFFVQIDNSTSPIREEKYVFQKVIGGRYGHLDINSDRSILIKFEDNEPLDYRMASLMLVIYFALIYCWHVDIVSDAAQIGQRLRISDGVVYFYGAEQQIRFAQELITICSANEVPISQWQLNMED